LVFVAFEEVSERQIELLGSVGSAGVFVPSQNEGLRYVTEGFFHRLGSNLDCFLEDASAKPAGKGKQVGLFERSGHEAQPGIDLAFSRIGSPVGPGGGASSVVHCRSPNGCPRSIEITCDQSPKGGWTLVQCSFCGRGYDKSKRVRKVCRHMAGGDFSIKWKWDATPRRGREATSARMLSIPAT
jgi:hypothetical protein